MPENKERKYMAPEGCIYHKDGRYIEIVYPLPSQSIKEYELVTLEEYRQLFPVEQTEELMLEEPTITE